MKTATIVKCASLFLAGLILSGCNCATHCSRSEPMARPGPIALRDVHFAFDSAKLTPTAKNTLREDYKNLGLDSESRAAKILLEGRADERGASVYNMTLSERRVAAVKKYLIELGAEKSQFQSRELGEKSPIVAGSSPEKWAMNRSVRVLVQ